MSVTEPLREEHRGLLPSIELLRTAADAVGSAPPEELLARVRFAHEFLAGHLIVHATAEDEALYPVVDELLGAPVTATMRRDHVEVARLTAELTELAGRLDVSGPSEADARELRRVLYGLYAVVRLHFAKEEEVYLPLLDERLDTRDAGMVFAGMEQAAEAARRATATAPGGRG